MPRLSNPTNKQAIRSLDNKMKPFVRNYGFCESCGTQQGLTDSHIIGCGHLKTRWDPRNNQCLCWNNCHSKSETQPMVFSQFVDSSSCGQYVDTMTVQANARTKPDYDLWFKIYAIIKERGYDLEQARQWLGRHIMLCELDLAKLD